jgi:hypothetical protein
MDGQLHKKGNFPMYGYDGFKITLEEVKGVVTPKFTECELPTAEEIEQRYFHKLPQEVGLIVGEDEVGKDGARSVPALPFGEDAKP